MDAEIKARDRRRLTPDIPVNKGLQSDLQPFFMSAPHVSQIAHIDVTKAHTVVVRK